MNSDSKEEHNLFTTISNCVQSGLLKTFKITKSAVLNVCFDYRRLFQLTENNETTAWDNQEICMADSSTCLGSLVNSYPKNILSFGEDEAGKLRIYL